jgi:hypothetical protein
MQEDKYHAVNFNALGDVDEQEISRLILQEIEQKTKSPSPPTATSPRTPLSPLPLTNRPIQNPSVTTPTSVTVQYGETTTSPQFRFVESNATGDGKELIQTVSPHRKKGYNYDSYVTHFELK